MKNENSHDEFKCPLCKQSVSKEIFEDITGIWKERKIAEKRFKEQEKQLIKQKKGVQKQLQEERKKLKSEQKSIIERRLSIKTRRYNSQLKKIEKEKNKMQEQFNKKISTAVKTAEDNAKKIFGKQLREKLEKSLHKEIKKATSKTQKELSKSNQTIQATRKQMATLQGQNLKQQGRINNLEKQLKDKTTPQLEGLLYEDQLLEALQKEFPNDKFDHTGKGGDIIQYVIYNSKENGLIVYECKRVSQWQSAHLEQTAKAKVQRKADYGILVTNAKKQNTDGFFIEKGIIVISPGGVLAVANIIRDQIITIARLKLTAKERQEAIQKTLAYLEGAEFKNALDTVIRKTVEMYEDLKKECYDHIRNWKKRYSSLKDIYVGSSQVQVKTMNLISGKKDEKVQVEIQPFPTPPNLIEDNSLGKKE